MKRILSVILSLALLASLLIIPMSVSADDSPSYGPTPFSIKEASTYFKPNDPTRVSNGLSPVIFITYKDNGTGNTMRKLYDYAKCVKDIPALSDGNVSVKKDIEGLGSYFNDTTNDYTSSNYKNDFNFNSNQITNYVDIIYDLGCTVDVNKIQHFAGDYATSTGLYQVYASVDVNNLFDDESWVLNYQNKEVASDKYYGCQQHEFEAKPARFVAFRILCPVTVPNSSTANTLRIYELAIYGTKTGEPVDYTVSTTGLEIGDTGKSGDQLDDETPNILKNANTDDSTVKVTVIGFNGNNSKTFDTNVRSDADDRKKALNDGDCGTHKDFDMVVNFYDTVDGSPVLSNGYTIDRNDVGGNITFNRNDADHNDDKYMDFTYDLGDYYKIKQFDLYSCKGQYNILYKTQAYEVYIGNDKETLYTDVANKVAEYENIFNTSGQKITFNEPKTGKYLGVRILMPAAVNNSANYPRIAEIAAYGKCVGTPPTIDVAPGKTCGSAVVTVTDVDGNLASVKVNGEEKVNDENKDSVKAKYEETIGKGKYTVVATDDKGNETTKEITVADHNYKYTADGAVITETCANCERPAETLTLTKPATIVYDGSDKSGSIDVVKTEGFANAAGKGDIVFKKGDKTVTEVKDAGDYVAELTIDGVTARLPFTVQQADLDPKDYAAPTVDDIEAGSTLGSAAFGANEKGAFTWAKPDTKVEYGSHTYKATFTPTNDNYETVENIDVTVNGKDETVPTGEIKIKETVWDKLVNLFIKDRETVTITGSDTGSGVAEIYYYVAEAEEENIADDAWTVYPKAGFKIEKEGNNVVYAKIVDRANNKTVINTDCIVLDTIAPVADVTNLGKYYGSLTVTVTDKNLDTVELNGKDVTLDEEGKFVVDAADGAQKIVITDKAGNETTYTVTVVEVKGFNPAEGKLTVDMDEKNVDKEKIAEKIEKGETVTFFDISVDNATGSTANVLEIPVVFDFTGKLNVRVLHNHGGNVNELKALTARPTAGFENGTFFADKENGKLYIYSKEFSPFAVAYHAHEVKHVEAKAATAEADGNIEYWYCEGCDKYFSDAAATKEIQKADTVVKYVAPSGGNTDSGSNAPTTGGETENNATVPGGTSPVTGETAMTVVLFAILLGALAVMGISIVKSRKAKSK